MQTKKEIISYIIFGILTTIVNIITYYILANTLQVNYIISNVISWITSVAFAYVTNRKWVFESKNDNIIQEIILFFTGRLTTGIIDTLLMILFISILTINDIISKTITQIIIIILNYILSKKIIFKPTSKK